MRFNASRCARRCCKPEQMDEVAQENGIGLSEAEFVRNLEFLVRGRFQRREDDQVGRIFLLWLTLADLYDSAASPETVDGELDKYEELSARICKEARPRRSTRSAA